MYKEKEREKVIPVQKSCFPAYDIHQLVANERPAPA